MSETPHSKLKEDCSDCWHKGYDFARQELQAEVERLTKDNELLRSELGGIFDTVVASCEYVGLKP